MNIEKIYNELKEINKELENLYIKELLSKIETEIRKNASYKETGKTRNNAIKRVANIIKKKETDFFTANLLYHEKVCFTKLFFYLVFTVLFL